MIIMWGSSFYSLLGGLALVLLAAGGAAAEWLARYALGVWVLLILCWTANTYQTIGSLRKRTEYGDWAVTLGLCHTVPQLGVFLAGYHYFLKELKKVDPASSALDIVISIGIYIAVTIAWNKVVMQDRASKGMAVLATCVHTVISLFFGMMFLTVT